MERRYKSVENLIHAWILEQESHAAGKKNGVIFFAPREDDAQKPYLPLTPLHSVDLYLDSQFTKAS